MFRAFYKATFVTCNASDAPDLSNVTDMSYMFGNATAFDQDIGSWDVTALTNASFMFFGATLSTANYDALLVDWNAQALQNGVTFHGGNSTYCAGSTRKNAAANAQ